jgi:hypothetical protein
MKPVYAVIAQINIRVTDFINDLPFVGTCKAPHSNIIPAHIFWLIVLLFSFSAVCDGTIILTAWSADRIIIGADGLSLQPDGAELYKTSCKITQANKRPDCFFAISGMQDSKDIKYDLVPLAQHACQDTGSMIDRAERFKNLALPEIRRAWRHVKNDQPKTYAAMKRLGPARNAVVFASGSEWVVVIVQYVEDSRGEIVSQESLVRTGNFATKPMFDEIGSYLGADAYHREHPEIDRFSDALFVRALLQGAIDREVIDSKRENRIKVIGPPMAIIEIHARSAKWEEQGACPEIKKEPTARVPDSRRKSKEAKKN